MSKRILIVDDEPDVLSLAAFRLKKSGYEILVATDGQMGLDMITSEKPDLVLLDLRLPNMDGMDVCKHVKSDKKLRHIPIILFTATEDVTVADVVREVEANDYIVKPFEPDKLLEKIKSFVE
jgi:two-component system alkaline phosphatase synthesis response regulator PhoP